MSHIVKKWVQTFEHEIFNLQWIAKFVHNILISRETADMKSQLRYIPNSPIEMS